MTFETTPEFMNKNHFKLISEWAHARNLIEGSNAISQMKKLREEVEELALALTTVNTKDTKDAIGDCAVVLAIIAEQEGFTFEECVAAAYDEIKDRKGKMVDGIFVKEIA